jgi:hypothetical protein
MRRLKMQPFDRLAFSLCVLRSGIDKQGRKLTTLISPPVEAKYPVFIAEPPSAPTPVQSKNPRTCRSTGGLAFSDEA